MTILDRKPATTTASDEILAQQLIEATQEVRRLRERVHKLESSGGGESLYCFLHNDPGTASLC